MAESVSLQVYECDSDDLRLEEHKHLQACAQTGHLEDTVPSTTVQTVHAWTTSWIPD